MAQDLNLLLVTAASLGFVHTLFGPDHYIPFIAMGKARKWGIAKTLAITAACGIGHVMSSIVIGFVGIAFGMAVFRLEALEAFRGNIAAWAMIAFGLAYFVWGMHAVYSGRPHKHVHFHEDGSRHEEMHTHSGGHAHVHGEGKANITPWVLFVIFVLGPCEPLIPLLMYPAAAGSLAGVGMVSLFFGSVTVLTMMAVVYLFSRGIELLPAKAFEKYIHPISGAMIFISGMAIVFLGL
ncbi:MAG: sulfite exporter TauE/SafE family protein [archaeon]